MNEFKKQMVSTLKESMNREELNTRATAKLLNLNPCYISMAMNESNWSSMSKPAWARIEEWFRTENLLAAFLIPEGEPIWEPKDKTYNIQPPNAEAAPVPFEGVSFKTEKAAKIKTKAPGETTDHFDHNLAELLAVQLKQEVSINYLRDLITYLKEKIATNTTAINATADLPECREAISETQRMVVVLDIALNLSLNGQPVRLG